MPDGLPKPFKELDQNLLRCSYPLEKSLGLVASGSELEYLVFQACP